MAAHFVNIDRDTPMLLPVDLRDWIAGDDMAHFILEAVGLVHLRQFRTNGRGCGSEQFPPRMMLALLIYCDSHGIFGSRRIEAATHHHLSVRYVAGNTHPDHDTICKFRRENSLANSSTRKKQSAIASKNGQTDNGSSTIPSLILCVLRVCTAISWAFPSFLEHFK